MTTYTYPQLVQLAQNAGFQGQNANTAAAIAMAESSGNPNSIAYNDGGKGYNSYGLMQINGVNDAAVGGASNALDPQTSFNQAYILSNGGSNFSPWSTYNSGAYSQYLDPSVGVGGGGITINAPSNFAPSPSDGFNINQPAFGGVGGATTAGSLGGPATAGSILNTPTSLSSGINATGGVAGVGTGNVNLNFGQQATQLLGNLFTAPITAAENYASSWFAQLTNWFSRGFLIVLGIVVIGIALWAMAGRPNPAVIMEEAA